MIQETQIETAIKELFKGLTFTAQPAGLYDPLRYMMEIGGKRIRPRLCLTAYSLYKDTLTDEILSPAAALQHYERDRKPDRLRVFYNQPFELILSLMVIYYISFTVMSMLFSLINAEFTSRE